MQTESHEFGVWRRGVGGDEEGVKGGEGEREGEEEEDEEAGGGGRFGVSGGRGQGGDGQSGEGYMEQKGRRMCADGVEKGIEQEAEESEADVERGVVGEGDMGERLGEKGEGDGVDDEGGGEEDVESCGTDEAEMEENEGDVEECGCGAQVVVVRVQHVRDGARERDGLVVHQLRQLRRQHECVRVGDHCCCCFAACPPRLWEACHCS